MTPEKAHPVLVVLGGVAFGFVVSGIGFTRYDELIAMFSFGDLRMFLAFAGAVALSMPAYHLLKRARPLPRRRLHKGTIPGAVVFGVGWVVCGACPSIAFAQLGQGKLWALVSLAGMVAGAVLFERLNRRYWHLGRDSC
jgi:uncharacterized membrane protein YedE/YeeE